MSVAVKWHRYRNRCVHCSTMFPCWVKRQRHCSRRCAGFSRGLANIESGRLGGQVTTEQSIARHMAQVLAVWPSMPPEAKGWIHYFGQQRYRAGRKSGERAGRRLGWSEALNEHGSRTA